MLLKIQDRFQTEITSILTQNRVLSEYFKLTSTESNVQNAIGQTSIGDYSFLINYTEISTGTDNFKICINSKEKIASEDIFGISDKSTLYFVRQKKISTVESILFEIMRKSIRSIERSQNRYIIQRKRKELEMLMKKLSDESDEKIESLERSHLEESEKNSKEKNLLHFLDFNQTDSLSDDYLEKLFKFLWKDLKKVAHINQIALVVSSNAGKSKIISFNGVAEHSIAAKINFQSADLSSQLAEVWKRPVAKIYSWQVQNSNKEIFLILECIDPSISSDKIQQYFLERISVLGLYLDRWLIEREMESLVDRWKKTFSSFSGIAHVIDDEFTIYQANYDVNRTKKCYELLANRNQPCESCPAIKNRDTSFKLNSETHVKTYSSRFKLQNKNYFFLVYEDVSQMLKLHSHIVQTEKMSTLGRLGNHLAHELNNPLTGIQAYVQTLLQDKQLISQLPDSAQSDFNEILKASIRCQKIIKNFLDFSQKKVPVLEKIVFEEVLQNTLILLKTALRNHRVLIELKSSQVLANSHDLQQVLFNLIKNSCQAMKDKGQIRFTQEVKNNKVIYYIEDSGGGFSDEVLSHLFQPFMTTKQAGEGTGLGLYLSKQLMNNMGADLQISSEKGKGAVVSLHFKEL